MNHESTAVGKETDDSKEEDDFINVEFEFNDPRETDYHSLCVFLVKYFGTDGQANEAWQQVLCDDGVHLCCEIVEYFMV